MFAGLTDRTWLWFAAGFYLAGLLLGTLSLLRGQRQSNTRINVIIALGYLCQLIGLYARGRVVGGCPLGNTFEIFQFTAWSATTLYLVVGVTFRLSLLGYFTSCLAAVLTLVSLAIPAWDLTRRAKIFGGNPWIELHASLALFSYGVFALLALTALMLVLRHYSLKKKHLSGWFSFLPPIMDLDHISVRLLVTGVVMMTASLIGGTIYWARDPASVNSTKLLMTVAIWLAYAIALTLRLKGHLLAKRFAWTCLALFGAALLSLGPVDASRHSPALPAPDHVVPR
ncbi:MAG TPA: cytochrome c biogenesis protein CcsA [Opitutus sp.]|nr:cytochrome c biogenesis protein CcsA [Opitutus sp.]